MLDPRPLDELLGEALRRAPGADRETWIETQCAGDAKLERDLRGLIDAHHGADGFMDEPLLANRLGPDGALEPGARVGRYELRELIGEGGFGQIWRAVQHEPVRRDVALKLLKTGGNSRNVLARFDLERQALAVMDHPNIAHVFDAGASSDGRPFFVMELVDGVPLLDYCDRETLDVRRRLELFLDVCNAIQHAHNKGVIHRDVKPSNILVTQADGQPIPKVIDFGVAKAIDEGPLPSTALTVDRQLVGTPAYMSPEQASLSSQDIDTRSDVYALGAVLYKLLTGVGPFDHTSLGDADLDELVRTIREVEPPRPSTQVTKLGDVTTTTAMHHHADPGKLRSQLRGDLDWIVMKCLEKARTRRYETVSALADDIRRHLNDEPVSAGPPSGIYRVRKFVRRNRAAVVVATSIIAALVVATIGLTVGYVRSARAETRAVAEAENAKTEKEIAEAINLFLQRDLLAAAAPSAAEGRGRDARIGDVLDAAARRIADAGEPGGRFAGKPLVEASIQHTLGHTYWELGDYATAVPHLERAMDLRVAALGEEEAYLVESASLLAIAYKEVGRVDDAKTLFAKTLETQERVLGEDDLETLRTMSSLATLYGEQGQFDEAEALLRRANDIQSRVLEEDDDVRLATMFNLSMLYQARGRYDEAEPIAREIMKVAARTLGPEHPRTLLATAGAANVLSYLERYDEAEVLYVRLLESQRRVLGEEHRDTLGTMMAYGSMLVEQGREEEAVPLLEGTVEIHERTLGADHQNTLIAVHNLGCLYVSQERYDDALPLLARAADGAAQLWPDGHWITGAFIGELGTAFMTQDRYDEAEPKLLEAHALVEAALGPAAPRTIERIEALAQLYDAWGKPEMAATWRARLPTSEATRDE